jgi:hypothetical protein
MERPAREASASRNDPGGGAVPDRALKRADAGSRAQRRRDRWCCLDNDGDLLF